MVDLVTLSQILLKSEHIGTQNLIMSWGRWGKRQGEQEVQMREGRQDI